MTSALIVVAVVSAVYVGILGLLWLFQERIVFQPPVNPESPDTATSTITYTTGDGVRLVAHVVQPERPTDALVVAFHGNAMISRWMIPWAREVAGRFQATVVLPEYRGYDGLSGTPSYAGAASDAAAALVAVSEKFGMKHSEMVYYGHSLGTAIATELAVASPPRALLLESPFTSARDMAARWPLVGLGFFWPAISRVHYETVRHVATLDVPVHVSHGERDIIIPSRMGRAVHDAARRPGQLLMIPEAGHNDVAIVGGDPYWRWIGEAIRPGPR
jgi:fermentation-respiration switch protein FrsA (DUF1100 family)